jgi:dTDP-glucose pyrophosphorylase
VWGIVPAAGIGSRIQPLAFSKELLPVGSVRDGSTERPRAVSEYLVERLVLGGATRICFVISPEKADIISYFGAGTRDAQLCYVVQPDAGGLCDAIFRALPLVRDDEHVLVGLPDTVWFPADGLSLLGDEDLSFLCFPVERPELFDAVVTDDAGAVREVLVKSPERSTPWIWGAFKMRGRTMRELHGIWRRREPRDPYLGTVVNAWLAQGGRATALKYGRAYVDTGTVGGYREAISLLDAAAKLDGPRGISDRVANGPRVRKGATASEP